MNLYYYIKYALECFWAFEVFKSGIFELNNNVNINGEKLSYSTFLLVYSDGE